MVRGRLRRPKRPDRPLRVAQICATTDGGLWMVQIAVGLQRRGFDVVAIVGSEDGGTAAALRKAGVPLVALPQRLWRYSRFASLVGKLPVVGRLRYVIDAFYLLGSALQMARLLRRLEVDVIHTHIFSSMLIGRVAGVIARVPVRVAMIASPLQLESALLRRLDLLTYRLDHRILAGCQHTNDLYRRIGVPARHLRTVGYGVDPAGFDPARADRRRLRRELGLAEDTVVVGQVAWFYGALMPPVAPPGMTGRGIKGHEDLMAAARLVLDKRPDVRFLVVGDGFGDAGMRHFEDIRRLGRELGIEDAVIFAGRRSDLVDVLASLDVSVQCSLSENYGGTIESLLMERPMVATAAGGMPEVVIDEETGLLVPVRHPEALAAAILRLVEDPELAHRLGKAGRARMLERHTIQHTIDGVIDAYRELAAERGLTRPPLDAPAPTEFADSLGSLGLMPSDVLFSESSPAGS
jgi:glycosyltransferase involved in cell wall biosynthesis